MNQIPRSTVIPAALLAGLCPLVANSIYEDTSGSGAKILAEAAAGQPVAAKISIVLFLVGSVALIIVVGVLAAAIARRTPALSGVVAVCGRRRRRDPTVAPDGHRPGPLVRLIRSGGQGR